MMKRLLAVTTILIVLSVGVLWEKQPVIVLPTINAQAEYTVFQNLEILIHQADVILIAKADGAALDYQNGFCYQIPSEYRNSTVRLCTSLTIIDALKDESYSQFGSESDFIFTQDARESTQRNAGMLITRRTYILFLDCDGQTLHPAYSAIALAENPGKKGGYSGFGLPDCLPAAYCAELRQFKTGDELIQTIREICADGSASTAK